MKFYSLQNFTYTSTRQWLYPWCSVKAECLSRARCLLCQVLIHRCLWRLWRVPFVQFKERVVGNTPVRCIVCFVFTHFVVRYSRKLIIKCLWFWKLLAGTRARARVCVCVCVCVHACAPRTHACVGRCGVRAASLVLPAVRPTIFFKI